MAMLRTPFQQKGLTMDKLFHRIVSGSFPPVSTAFYNTKMRDLVDDMVQVAPTDRPTIDAVASAALLARTSSSMISSGGSEGLSSLVDTLVLDPGDDEAVTVGGESGEVR